MSRAGYRIKVLADDNKQLKAKLLKYDNLLNGQDLRVIMRHYNNQYILIESAKRNMDYVALSKWDYGRVLV